MSVNIETKEEEYDGVLRPDGGDSSEYNDGMSVIIDKEDGNNSVQSTEYSKDKLVFFRKKK